MAFPFNSRFDQLGGGAFTLRIREKAEAGRVQLPYYYYDIVAEGVPVGKISVRIGDNYHTYYNGHIGYEVDEGARGHGYARRACALVLDVARFHGMKRLYLTCAEGNIASRRTIEHLGAEFLETCPVPREYFAWREGMERQRIYRLAI